MLGPSGPCCPSAPGAAAGGPFSSARRLRDLLWRLAWQGRKSAVIIFARMDQRVLDMDHGRRRLAARQQERALGDGAVRDVAVGRAFGGEKPVPRLVERAAAKPFVTATPAIHGIADDLPRRPGRQRLVEDLHQEDLHPAIVFTMDHRPVDIDQSVRIAFHADPIPVRRLGPRAPGQKHDRGQHSLHRPAPRSAPLRSRRPASIGEAAVNINVRQFGSAPVRSRRRFGNEGDSARISQAPAPAGQSRRASHPSPYRPNVTHANQK